MKFSRLSVLFTAAIVATSVLASTSKAQALTYNLNGVTLQYGATATGSFDYVLAGNVYSNINITYTGFPANITFSQSSFQSGSANNFFLSFLNSGNTHQLSFNFLPSLGGSSSSITSSSFYNFNNNAGFTLNNQVTGGVVSQAATVPFDIPGGATIPALGGLLALGLMRKARKSLASNTPISEPISEMVS